MSASKSMSRSRWLCSQPCAALGGASGLEHAWKGEGSPPPLPHPSWRQNRSLLALFLPTCTFHSRIRSRAAAAMDGWMDGEGRKALSFIPSFLPPSAMLVVPSIAPSPSPHVSTTFHFRMGDPSVLSLHKTLEEMGEMHRRKQQHSERGSTELC